MMRAAFAIMALLILAACAPPSRERRDDDTQVVAQWPDRDSEKENMFEEAWGSISDMLMEDRIEDACGELCAFEGDDEGSVTYNLYLYTRNIPATVAMLIDLENRGKIRAGMHIGVAHYTNPQHTKWDYRPVYPKGLKQFTIVYRPSSMP